MERRPPVAAVRRATVCAFVCALLAAAPAGAAERLGVDLRAVGVDVSPGGANVNLDAGPAANLNAGAGSDGVRVQGEVAGAQLDVNVDPPSTPTLPPTPQPPAVPDPGGVVGGATGTVGEVVDGATGGGGQSGGEPAASPAANGGGSGGGGSGGSGAASPGERGSRGTGTSGSRGGGDDDAGGGRRGGSGGRGGPDGDAAGGGDGASVDSVGAALTAASADGAGGANNGSSTDEDSSGVGRTLERVVEVIPVPMWVALAVLALLAAGFFGRSQVVSRRARRLTEQREELLQDVGLLQQALLPEIPEKLGELATSVAYRPADGPAAGGDFYDAFLLDGERVAIIVGDVSGHGRAALARTALMRYTLRAYLDAGLEPRRALKVAGKALDDDLGGDFATVVLAIHDPAHATLTYASAGHPPPLVTGSSAFDPVTALSSPPIGAGLPTGMRQTTLHLPGDAVACFFTDGLIEAKEGDGLVGREKLADMLADLGPRATAQGVIDAVAFYADSTPDDMAACVLRPDPAGAADHVPDRLEEVELNALDLAGDRVERFLAACAVAPEDAAAALKAVEAAVGEFGGALLRVRVDKTGARCEVESAAGLHDPLGAPSVADDAPTRV